MKKKIVKELSPVVIVVGIYIIIDFSDIRFLILIVVVVVVVAVVIVLERCSYLIF